MTRSEETESFREGVPSLGHQPVPVEGSAIAAVPGLGHAVARLAAGDVRASVRAGNPRLPFHLDNTGADVDRALDVPSG